MTKTGIAICPGCAPQHVTFVIHENTVFLKIRNAEGPLSYMMGEIWSSVDNAVAYMASKGWRVTLSK